MSSENTRRAAIQSLGLCTDPPFLGTQTHVVCTVRKEEEERGGGGEAVNLSVQDFPACRLGPPPPFLLLPYYSSFPLSSGASGLLE